MKAQEHVDWQARFPPKEQEVWREPSRRVRRGVVRLHHLLQMLWPLLLLLLPQSSEQVVERSVEPLALPVTLGMIRCGPGLLNVVEPAELLNDLGLKVTPLVAMKTFQYPEALEPLSHEDFRDSDCLLVPRRDGLRVLGEDIRQ